MNLRERLAAAKVAANEKALDAFMASRYSTQIPKDQLKTKMINKLEVYQAQCSDRKDGDGHVNGGMKLRCIKMEDITSSEIQLNVMHSEDYQEAEIPRNFVSDLRVQIGTRPSSNLPVSNAVDVQNSEQACSVCPHNNVTTLRDTCQPSLESTSMPDSSAADVTAGVSSLIPEKQIDHHVSTLEAAESSFHKALEKLHSCHKRKWPPDLSHDRASSNKKRLKTTFKMPRNTGFRGNLQKLRYITTLFQAYLHSVTVNDPAEVQDVGAQKIRDYLHQMAFFDFVDYNLIIQSGVLNTLRSIFLLGGNATRYHPDIGDDSWVVYKRWYMQSYDPDLLLGIITVPANRSRGIPLHRIHDRTHGPPLDSAYYGTNLLALGQWWPFQICAVRDGAHGELEAGICGDAEHGAYSIVMSGEKYQDVDNGNTIEYCGTKGTATQISAGTSQLLRSYELQNDIRVLRSHKLSKENPYRPIKGIRYDGCYKITGFVIIDPNTSHHRFTMVRDVYQTPIRYQGALQRPTTQELIHYEELRYRVM